MEVVREEVEVVEVVGEGADVVVEVVGKGAKGVEVVICREGRSSRRSRIRRGRRVLEG